MGRSLSPLLRQELANLDKDTNSRQSAMKALTSYAKHLDTKNLPQFLAEVSDKQVPSTTPSGEFTISLYEVLARVHGRNIVPQIENIMGTIMCTLSSSGGSFPLQQACSKVIPAVARYGIEPSTPDKEKTRIIGSLCKPLCDSLMGPHESTASGSALCLKALVESNNWKYASSEMVNEVCLKVAGALHEKSTQSNSHMGLVMALVKHNGLTAEAYARSLVRSGLRILEDGSNRSSQKRLSAIQMINFFMKFVDPRSIQSELEKIIEVMEKCQNDRMPFVRGAAFEASQTAKNMSSQKGSRHEIGLSPISNASFKNKNKSPFRSPNSSVPVKKISEFASPESQVVESSIKCDGSFDSPISSVGQCSTNFAYNKRSNRRLWDRENSSVDVSLKDGLFLKGCTLNDTDGTRTENSMQCEIDQSHQIASFSGFSTLGAESSIVHENTPSHQKQKLVWNGMDEIKIYSTPRKLFHSLQSSSEISPKSANTTIALNADAESEKLNAKAEESKELANSVITSSKECEDDTDENESVFSTDVIEKDRDQELANSVVTSSKGCEDDADGHESVFSTDVVEKDGDNISCAAENEENIIVENVRAVKVEKPKKHLKMQFGFVCSVIFLIMVVVFLSMSWHEDNRNVVPKGLVPT